MKLVYSIPDKLYYFQNFLDYPTYKKIHYDTFRSKLISLESVKKEWHEKLIYGHNNFVEKTLLNRKNKCLTKLKILLKSNPFYKIKNYYLDNEKFDYVLHSMKNGAGINWHGDGSWQYGITYYINRRWNDKFGGELMFKDEKTNGFLPLVGNSLVIIKSPLQHKVVNVTKPLVPRKTIQVFLA